MRELPRRIVRSHCRNNRRRSTRQSLPAAATLFPTDLTWRFSVKELARRMATPTRGDWQRFKRFGRYLVNRPRLQQVYHWQSSQRTIKTYIDVAWAGCRESRRSSIGGCVALGAHTFKGWSKTQTFIALSSGESELYVALKASAETLGFVSLLKDLRYLLSGEVWGDASAALGIINRKGLGKTRHIETCFLWIQQTAADKRLRCHKVLGKENPADFYTKYLDAAISNLHTTKLGYSFMTGRSTEAPQLHVLTQLFDECSNGVNQDLCEWVQSILSQVVRYKFIKKSQCKRDGVYSITQGETVQHGTDENHERQRQCGCVQQCVAKRRPLECLKPSTTIDVWQQVFWGYKQRVQGSTGSNAAQLSCPQDSTLVFQPRAGVSCGAGLRHGVTMYPRGRHLREDMTLLPHGLLQRTASEQQPEPQQPSLGTTMRCKSWRRRGVVIRFPRRDVNQRSSIAKSGGKWDEFSHVIGPKVIKLK